MIGDYAHKGLTALSVAKNRQPHALVSIQLKLLKKGDDITKRPDIFQYRAPLKLKYRPYSKEGKKKIRPYCLISELLSSGTMWFESYREFRQRAQDEEILRFLLEYSDIDEDTFELAVNNAYIDIYIPLDIKRYVKDLKRVNGIDEYERIPLLTTLNSSELMWAMNNEYYDTLTKLGYDVDNIYGYIEELMKAEGKK